MANKNRSDIRKTDFLVIRSQRNDDIVKIVTPQFFQVGLPGDEASDTEFDRSLIVYGNINASSFVASNTYVTASTSIGAPLLNTQVVKSIQLTGSLTKLADGSSYLKEGSNITIATGSDGQITIGASGFSNNPLSVGAGLGFDSGTTYDGSASRTLSPSFHSGGGLGAPTAAGLRVDFSNLSTAAPSSSDLLLFADSGIATSDFPKKATIASILALGGGGSVSALTIGQALQLRSGNSTWDGTTTDTILVTTASNAGLEVSGDALRVKLDGASLASAAAGISVNLDGATLSIGGSGISVAKLPNALTQGTGIANLSFDGSSATTVSIDTSTVPQLGSSNSFTGNNTFSNSNTFSSTNSFAAATFSGNATFSSKVITAVGVGNGLTGSLQEVSSGVPYLVGGSNVNVAYNTPAAGQITINASLGAGGALTQGAGIATFTYNGSGNATVGLDSTGLSTSGNRNSYAILSNGGTTFTKQLVSTLIDEVDRSAIMVEGTGIDITFNGNSNPAEIAVQLDGTTLGTDGSGNITVNRTANALTDGIGIKDFTFDGSSAGQVIIDNSIVATLTGSQFSGDVGITGSLEVEKNSILRGYTKLSGITHALNFSGSLTKLIDGTSYLREGNQIDIVTQSNGGVLISYVPDGGNAGGGNSDKRAEYLVLSPTGSLVNERVMTLGRGLTSTDAGAGGNYTLKVLDSIVATLTGSVFSGNVVAQSGLSGSLQMLSNGTTRYIVGTGGVKVSTSSAGQVIVSSSLGRIYAAGNGLKLSSDVFSVDNSVVATLTGSQFSGNVGITGSLQVEGIGLFRSGLSGSIQQLKDGATPYIIGTGSISVTTSSAGQLIISSSNTSATGASVSVKQIGSAFIAEVSKFVFSASVVTNDGGNQVTIKPVIGSAEDGTYTDGLFTDFAYVTPVGIAIDRFNEVLLDLAPSPAPLLDNINSNDTGTAAYLSFGSSAAASGYTNVGASAGYGVAVNVNGLYQVATNSTNLRRAIFNGSVVMDGRLNSDVAENRYANSQLNFPQYSFGDADQGIIQLEVNGAVLHTASLSSVSVGAGTPGSGTFISTGSNGSGFMNLSQTGSAKQQDGSLFNTFKHRTGNYQIGTADQRNGWNYSRVTRVVNGVTSSLTNYIEWVNDSNADNIAAANNQITAVNLGGIKQLSGVSFFKSGSAEYRVDVSNAYKTCYDLNAITFATTNISIANIAKPTINTGIGENSGKVLSLTGSATLTDQTLLNGSVSASVSVTHPFTSKNLTNGGSTTAAGFLLWNVSETSTAISETFTGETYRVQSGSFNAQTDVTGGSYTWNSALHMSGSGGHSDGLLVYNNALYAPDEGLLSGDFRSTADGGSLAFAPAGNPNYSGINSGMRTFYRKFQNTEGATRDSYTLTFGGSTNITTAAGALGSNNIKVFAKLPDDASGTSNTTGWLDCSTLFASASYANDSGCRVYTNDTTVPATLYCTLGAKSIQNNDHLIVKVLADATWTGNISSIAIDFANSNASDAPDLADLSSADSGVDAKLSFGPTKQIPAFSDVTAAAGVAAAVGVNGEYLDGNPNARRLGIFAKDSIIDGPLNVDSSSGGFGEGNCGTLKLEVNGSEIAAAEINLASFAGSGYPGSGASTVANGNGTGFTNVSTTQPRTGSNNFPNFDMYFRTAKFLIAAADQREGWNYVRAIHTLGGVDRTTSYVEWVNDSYTNAMSYPTIGFDNFGGSSVFYLSGVRYLDNSSSTVTGSLKANISGSHSNIYSKLSNAFSTTDMSNVSINQIIFSGSGYTYTTHNSDSTVSLPAIDTAFSQAQSNDLHVTASFGCTLTNSLPSDGDTASAKFRVFHPQKSTLTSPTQSKSNFLIYSASDSSTRNITENFSGELYRLISASYDAKADITNASYVWNSQNNMNSVANHDDGLLIFDGKLHSPKRQGNSGDFRNVQDQGIYQGPYGNANYSSLTKGTRTYYRAFRNDTSADVAQVMLQFTGSAEIIPRSGGFASGSIGSNNMIHVDIKIPGKTAWLDLAKAGSGAGTFNVNGNGCLKGTPGQTVNSNGAQTLCSFQGETSDGTGGAAVPAAASDFVLIRINADEDWTGNLNTVRLQWST